MRAWLLGLIPLLVWGCDDSGTPLPAPDRIQWARSIGSPEEDVSQSFDLGPLEQGVLAVRSRGELEIGDRRFSEVRIPRTVLVRFDRSGELSSFTSLSPAEQAEPVDLFELEVATDPLQNVVLAGSLVGADFVLEDGTVLARRGSSSFDPFVALLRPDGSTLWAVRGEQARVQHLAVGTAGLWIAGRATGAVAFDDFTAQTEAGDAFVARLGAEGTIEVFVRFSGDGLRIDDLDVGPAGVYVAGESEGDLVLSSSLERYPGAGPFVARLGVRFGRPDWVRTELLAPATASIRSVRARDGVAFVFGRYSGAPPELPNGQDDVWIGRLDEEGQLGGLSSIGVRGQISLSSAAPDGAGGLWLSGSFRDQLEFGERLLDSGGGLVGFLGRIGRDGQAEWLETLGSGPGVRAAAQLSATPSGDVVLVGVFEGPLTLLDREIQGQGDTDVLLIRYRGR
ncbi:MAG: hypothetical protein AAGD10_05935 [Myxococcota bacterium]